MTRYRCASHHAVVGGNERHGIRPGLFIPAPQILGTRTSCSLTLSLYSVQVCVHSGRKQPGPDGVARLQTM